jgi:outer membrane protein assembly factor BamD (BamD/ComL family)
VRKFFFILLLTACCLGGCASIQARIQGGPQGGHGQDAELQDAEFDSADGFIKQKRYNEAIAAYNKIAQESMGSERGARALYDSAFTYAFYDNPHKDYAQALQEFDAFLQMYPDHEKALDAQNWRYVLKTMLELKKENGRLLQNIDELKQIDIRHEERRKGK